MTDERKELSVSPRLKSGDNQGSPGGTTGTTGPAIQPPDPARIAHRVETPFGDAYTGVPLTDRPRFESCTAHAEVST